MRKRIRYLWLLFFFFLIGSAVTVSKDVSADTLDQSKSNTMRSVFPDDEIRRVLKELMGKKDNSSVTQTELDGIKIRLRSLEDTAALHFPGDVKDLEGLQYLNYVESFSFEPGTPGGETTLPEYGYVNHITDLSPLGKINGKSQVKRLLLGHSRFTVEQLEVLKKPQFDSLIELNISKPNPNEKKTDPPRPPIKPLIPAGNLDFLTGKENLEKISFQWNNVPNINTLAGKENLRFIYGKGNQIESLLPLKEDKKLEKVYVDNNETLHSIAGIENHPSLNTFSIQTDRNVKTINELATNPALTDLWLGENQIEDVGPLANLQNLQNLTLDGNRIYDLRPLEDSKAPKDYRILFAAKWENYTNETSLFYNILQPFMMQNPIYNIDGSQPILGPDSKDGVALSPEFTQNGKMLDFSYLDPEETELVLKWSEVLAIFERPDGTVEKKYQYIGTYKQKVQETPLAGVTIENQQVDFSDENKSFQYEVRLLSNDGQTYLDMNRVKEIAGSIGDKLQVNKDPTSGTFSLKNGEKITLPAVPGVNARYEVKQVTTGDFTTQYKVDEKETQNYQQNELLSNPVHEKTNHLLFINGVELVPFTLFAKDDSPMPLATQFEYRLALKDVDGTYQGIIYDENHKEVEKIDASTKETSFGLKDGWSLEFKGIPKDVKIAVKQLEPGQDYQTQILEKEEKLKPWEEGSEYHQLNEELVTEKGDNQLTFVNHVAYIPPLTGISTQHNTPFFLIAGSLLGVYSFIIIDKKRREHK